MTAPTRLLVAAVAAALVAAPHERRIAVRGASLYVRDVGEGLPTIVLHGGPDFDHRYLLPDLDRLADRFHLVYYDQRGRGQSADRVAPDDVSLASEMEDLDAVRQQFHVDAPLLLGHSWGTVLALEYAVRHPTRVSRLILMNPAPASGADLVQFRSAYAQRLGPELDRQRAIAAGPAYQRGDPDAVTARYRIHFKPALARDADYERLMTAMHAAFVAQGAAGIVKARAVEDRLMRDTWDQDGYDLLSKLGALRVPALIIGADHDFIPRGTAEHIAHALPNSRLVVLANCGHFSYLECPADVRSAIDDFVRMTAAPR